MLTEFFSLYIFNCRVILATGFIHVLPDAMTALTDPCLGVTWNEYGAYAGLFAMFAALGMQLFEFLAHQRYRSTQRKHSHLTAHVDGKECIKSEISHGKGDEVIKKEQTNTEADKSTCIVHEDCETKRPKIRKQTMSDMDDTKNPEESNENTEEVEGNDQTISTHHKSEKNKLMHKNSDKSGHIEDAHHHTINPENEEHKDCVAIEILHIEPTIDPLDNIEQSGHFHGAAFQDTGMDNTISTYLLELGIALHSVLIGLALGTTTNSFVALFIALCFHQFFEAIALGAQIANLKTTSIKPAIFLVVFYSLTTPVGIAIGIGIHSGTYNPEARSSLLVSGILDSLSAGILIYVALVNLITAEMGANAHAFYSLSARLKLLYYMALYLGAAAMAVIGRWA
jgi:ZIP zinc/iron transport family